MPTSLTVTPGIVFTGSTVVDADALNAAANPTVSIGDGSLPATAINAASFISTFGDSFKALNYLPYAAFPYEDFPASAVACSVGVRTRTAAGWYVNPTGAAVNAERDATAPDTRSGHSLKVYGATGCTALRIGTYVPPGNTTLAQPTAVFSIYLYNGTGVAFTPSLEIMTSATDGDEGNLNAPVVIAGQACAAGQWTRVNFTITTSDVTAAAWKRGAHLAILITAGAGVMDAGADYCCFAQAALEKTSLGAAWPAVLPVRSAFPSGMILPWPGDSSSIPTGWLLANGAAVSRTTYRELFNVVGTKYGVGDGSSTFNLPDLRGGLMVGAEVSGAVQSRMELELSGSAITSGSAIATVTSTANLRAGMGVYHASIPDGTTIASIDTGTQITLSASASATASPVTLRFSKLGAADAEVIGAAGAGIPTAGRKVAFSSAGCATSIGTKILTVPDVTPLAVGMVVDCAGVPAGTTIEAFITATSVRLTADATATASGLTATFRVNAPEHAQYEVYQHLRNNPVIFCSWTGASPDSTLQMQAGLSVLIRKGMTVSGTGIAAGCYVTGITPGTPDDFNISPGTTAAAPGAYPAGTDLTFGAGSLTSTAAQSDGPRLIAVNYMIKS